MRPSMLLVRAAAVGAIALSLEAASAAAEECEDGTVLCDTCVLQGGQWEYGANLCEDGEWLGWVTIGPFSSNSECRADQQSWCDEYSGNR